MKIRFACGVFLIAMLAACGGESENPVVPWLLPANDPLMPARSFSQAEPGEELAGGNTTRFVFDDTAFSLPAANLTPDAVGRFNVGNRFFTDAWQEAPGSSSNRDGLGPLFNMNACQGCHLKDGRGHAPEAAATSADTLLLRLSIPPQTAEHVALLANGTVPSIADEVYGGQLQDRAIEGVEAEGRVEVSYQEIPVTFADGFVVTLRQPDFSIADPAYGSLPENLRVSPRLAQPVFGLGLLQAVPESLILSWEDPDDANGDGISGRANRVWEQQNGQAGFLGRFGWKAGQPTVRQQSAGAFNGDIGITSSLFITDHCTASQIACLNAPNGGSPEVSDEILDAVSFYVEHLAVPARRNVNDAQVLAGKKLFYDSGCIDCHRPKLLTSQDADSEFLANQLIWPYTDLLLHDMGEGLADEHTEFLAEGREWRTPPLWGLGLNQVVSQEATFLHDGRARTLLEAVLWHGGEAQPARDRVLEFNSEERAALLAFLNSL